MQGQSQVQLLNSESLFPATRVSGNEELQRRYNEIRGVFVIAANQISEIGLSADPVDTNIVLTTLGTAYWQAISMLTRAQQPREQAHGAGARSSASD